MAHILFILQYEPPLNIEPGRSERGSATPAEGFSSETAKWKTSSEGF